MTIAWPKAAFAPVADTRGWRTALLWLCAVELLLLAAFARDVATLTHLWWTSTTFGHCLFIPPVLAWLVWQRRDGLRALTPTAWWPGLALVLAGAAGWFAGDVAGVALARQLGLVLMLDGAVVTLLGPMVARALAFPLGYALFLVPFGESMEGPLQQVTVWITMHLLHLVGLPAVSNGVLITVSDQYFEVAEACSGAKFEIAMLAYGVLVAHVCYRSWVRRAAFLAMALTVPVLANGVRAFATILAAHLTSVEAATGYDHIVYGWIFFGLVMAGVLAIGWRWFDRPADAPLVEVARLSGPVRHRIALPLAAALVLGAVAIFPTWSTAIAARSDTLPDRIALPQVPGWHLVPATTHAAWAPHYPGADHLLFGRYAHASGAAVDLAIAVDADQREGHEIVGFGIGVLQEDDHWVRIRDEAPLAGGSVMRITTAGRVERLVATWYRVGDTLTASPARVKLATLRAKLLGGRQAAVAIHLSVEVTPGRDARADMTRFLAALGPLDQLADRSAGR